MHQHGGAGWPVARASAWAHRFGCPHRGQRVGSGMGSGGVIRVVFCGMKRRAARAAQAFGKTQERVTMSQALTAPQLDALDLGRFGWVVQVSHLERPGSRPDLPGGFELTFERPDAGRPEVHLGMERLWPA